MNKKELKNFIKNSLLEDIGEGDHTSNAILINNCIYEVQLLVKDSGIIAGVDLAKRIFKEVDKTLNFKKILNDGDKVKKGDIVFIVKGNGNSILKAERLTLNCMQRMSAIATKTSYLNSLIINQKTKILDTRKTTPQNRIIEKWAVRIGGGVNHRFGLFDMIMIKDNHIDFIGGIKKSIQAVKKYLLKNNKNLDIIVEARNIKEVNEIIQEQGVKRILLDNFDINTTKRAVEIINQKCEIESSGNITEKNIKKYAECGVDFISTGTITHSIINFDLSLNAI